MAEDAGRRERDLALHHVQIGVAHAASMHLYEHLALERPRSLDRFDCSAAPGRSSTTARIGSVIARSAIAREHRRARAAAGIMGRREREREIGEPMSKRSATTNAEPTAVDDHAEPDFVALAEGLIPLADEHAEAAEERGALADEVVEALHATGLWAIWLGRRLGGAELAPVPSLEVIEHLSYADASTGWVVTAAALATGADAAFLGDEAVDALFGGERRRSTSAPEPSRARRCPPTAASC